MKKAPETFKILEDAKKKKANWTKYWIKNK